METDCLLRGTDRVVISPKILFLKSLTVVFLSPTESAQLVPKFALFTACPIYSPQYINIKTQPKFSSHSDTPICSFSTRHSAVHLFIFLIFQLTFLRRTSGQNVETLTFVDFQCPCNNTLFLTPPLPLSSLNSVYACQNAVRLFCPQVTPFPDNNKKCKFGFTGSAKGDTVSGVTQCCCTAISGVAQCCCTAISGVAQCSCTAVSGVAQCCCTAISGVAQCCCTAVSGVAVLLHSSHWRGSVLLHSIQWRGTVLLHSSQWRGTVLLHSCHWRGTLLLHSRQWRGSVLLHIS